jgi:rubrerythrin
MAEKVKKEKEGKPTPLDRFMACYLCGHCGHYRHSSEVIPPRVCPKCSREGYVRYF